MAMDCIECPEVAGKTVKCLRLYGSTQDENEDGTIDDVVEDFDTDQSGGNNEGGCGGSGLLAVGNEKVVVGPWYDETNDENTADVEDQDTPEGPPDGNWDIPSRVLSFANGDTDEFGPHIGEESVDEGGPETKEGSQALPVGNLFVEVLTHGAVGRIPVTETTAEKGKRHG